MKKQNDGTYLQDELAKALKAYCEYNEGYFYRFYDTRSARVNYLPAQPGDYLLNVPGISILIECKSTTVGASVVKMAWNNKITKNQMAKHRLWHRSGHPSLYLWGDLTNKTFEWHLGETVVSKVNNPIFSGQFNKLSLSIQAVLTELKKHRECGHAIPI